MIASQHLGPHARAVYFFSWLRSLWGWVCCLRLQVRCRWSRLLAQAKSCGVKVCMYITEAKETIFFPNAEKSIASSHTAWQGIHIVSYDRIPAPLGCSRDINGLARKDFFAPTALLLTPHAAHGTFLPCCDHIWHIHAARGPQSACCWLHVTCGLWAGPQCLLQDKHMSRQLMGESQMNIPCVQTLKFNRTAWLDENASFFP